MWNNIPQSTKNSCSRSSFNRLKMKKNSVISRVFYTSLWCIHVNVINTLLTIKFSTVYFYVFIVRN